MKIPVTPPKMNIESPPTANHIGVVSQMEPPHIVASMENTIKAKGTEIRIVVMLNGMASLGSSPEMNWWWAQTRKLSTPAISTA